MSFFAKIESINIEEIMMRKDILDVIRTFFMKGIKPNFSSIARQYDCDPRTVKRYFLKGESATQRKKEPIPA